MENGHQMIYRKLDATCDMDELSLSNLKILDSWIDKLRDVESFNLLPEKITSIIKPIRLDINFKTEILRGSEILASIKEFSERKIDFCLRQRGSVACLASLSIM